MSEPNSPGPSNENESSICIDEDQVIVEPVVPMKTEKPPTVQLAPGIHRKVPYIGDPMLLPRVVEYINSLQDKNNPGERYIDVEEIVDELQRRYREYRKKKRAPFKASVQKALTIIMQETCSDEEEESEEDSDMMDMSGEEEASRPDSNNQVVNMYLQNKARQGKVTMDGDKELIDIGSSDEEEEEEEDDDDEEETLRQISATQAALKQQEVARAYSNGVQGVVASARSNAAPKEASRPVPNILRKRKSPPEVNSSNPRQQQQQGGSQNKKRKLDPTPPSTSFSDIGGNENCLKEVCQLLVHMKHPEVYKQLGVSPPRGFLLHGPPGCGKTLLAHAIAGELQLPLLKVAATELVAGVSGESEERIRELFEQATSSAPCVLFIDEIDAIAPHRATAQREMERRIVAQLLASMDELAKGTSQVLVVGATNRPDSLDPALRRAGRFDREVSLGIPDEKARTSILGVLCSKLRLAPGIDLAQLGRLTPGFVGADLAALAREAAMAAVNRVLSTLKNAKEEVKKPEETVKAEENIVNGEMAVSPVPEPKLATSQPLGQLSLAELTDWLKDKPPLSSEQLQSMSIEQQDFDRAIKCVQPSAKREGFATVPGVTWDDVGSLKDVREELKIAILAPVKFAEEFATLGLSSAAGVLLCGPPGCGKTLLAKAVANEAGINFISVKGPELLNMYVGESERAVRQCFQRAKNSAPCVIFFDELDSLCPKRSEHGEGGASARVVNQMLTEMDGVEGRQGVFLMAATNRPDMVDPAVLRPGRLDKTLYIGLPGPEDRVDILRALTKNGTSPQLDKDVDLSKLGVDNSTDGYTGADLAALVREASLFALRGIMAGEPDASLVVKSSHFSKALDRVRPSVSDVDKKRYESLRQLYGPKPLSS